RPCTGTRLCVDRLLLGLAGQQLGLDGWALAASTPARCRLGRSALDAARQSLAHESRPLEIKGALGPFTLPAVADNSLRSRCRDRSSANETSRSAHVNCRRGDRSPS